MQLSHIVRDMDTTRVVGPLNRPVRDVVYDSRKVSPGDVFVAITGQRSDGAAYIIEAAQRGAAAIVTERSNVQPPVGVTLLEVRQARLALAKLAATRWGQPSSHLGVAGVTGTDGKTTTATLIAGILNAAGDRAGLWSTVEIRGRHRRPNLEHRTTPEAPELQAHLAEVAEAGCRWSVLELSSHGLAQGRADGCEIDIAVSTNLSPEHLDFHRTFEAYRAAKTRLFELVSSGSGAFGRRFGVVNADDPNADYFSAACAADVLTYGINGAADVRATDIRAGLGETSFQIESPIGSHRLTTTLVGRFNVYNWLAAITVAIGRGYGWDVINRAARLAIPVPGRAQRIQAGQDFTVVVDFAHTPQALAAVLSDCRRWTRGRVIVVFGHPGERDRRNRRGMGSAAVHSADLAIVTSDDSYGEEPGRIISDILAGFRMDGAIEGKDFLVIPDRREAICRAITMASRDDLVLIAGRGDLSYLESGNARRPFDDARVAQELLNQYVSDHRSARLTGEVAGHAASPRDHRHEVRRH
jgi:UDP-N-acetylmuramoyl-L-alanyl-D-glutamate--2,6-diaminopimelate ligase